jgi:hypothetical protein
MKKKRPSELRNGTCPDENETPEKDEDTFHTIVEWFAGFGVELQTWRADAEIPMADPDPKGDA